MRCCSLDSSRVMLALLKVVSVRTPSELSAPVACMVDSQFSNLFLAWDCYFGDLECDLVIASISDLSGEAFCFLAIKNRICLYHSVIIGISLRVFRVNKTDFWVLLLICRIFFSFWGTFSANALPFCNNDILLLPWA